MWEVIGYDIQTNETGEMTGVTLYCSKDLPAGSGAGKKVCREWYRPGNVAYRPALGDQIVICKEDFGKFSVITEIIKM